MDDTYYKIQDRMVRVYFDLRSEENCVIDLSFSADDVLAIINMEYFGNSRIELEGMGGSATLPGGTQKNKKISFQYPNGGQKIGTVVYSYKRLRSLLDNAFTELG